MIANKSKVNKIPFCFYLIRENIQSIGFILQGFLQKLKRTEEHCHTVHFLRVMFECIKFRPEELYYAAAILELNGRP